MFDNLRQMTFSEWKALSHEERIRIRETWKPYEDGCWHTLNAEAVEHFKREHGGHPNIVNVLGGTFHGGRLIMACARMFHGRSSCLCQTITMNFASFSLGIEKSNKADAPNAAMTLRFQSEHHWRVVGDLRR
jgi:hypothetical protein